MCAHKKGAHIGDRKLLADASSVTNVSANHLHEPIVLSHVHVFMSVSLCILSWLPVVFETTFSLRTDLFVTVVDISHTRGKVAGATMNLRRGELGWSRTVVQ